MKPAGFTTSEDSRCWPSTLSGSQSDRQFPSPCSSFNWKTWHRFTPSLGRILQHHPWLKPVRCCVPPSESRISKDESVRMSLQSRGDLTAQESRSLHFGSKRPQRRETRGAHVHSRSHSAWAT